MFVTKLVAVLNASAGGTAPTSVGIQEQHPLQALEQEEAENRDAAEREQREGVDRPRLLARWIDAHDSVDEPLDGQEDAVAPRGAALENAREIRAEQARRDEDERHEREKLQPAGGAHSFSGASSA